MSIPSRDFEYIENRLVSPAPEVVEAIERLRKLGQVEEARDLMTALKTFTDECRRVRYLVGLGQQGGRT
jgi:hypothetical protein